VRLSWPPGTITGTFRRVDGAPWSPSGSWVIGKGALRTVALPLLEWQVPRNCGPGNPALLRNARAIHLT
jgi:hypothetical protein